MDVRNTRLASRTVCFRCGAAAPERGHIGPVLGTRATHATYHAWRKPKAGTPVQNNFGRRAQVLLRCWHTSFVFKTEQTIATNRYQ